MGFPSSEQGPQGTGEGSQDAWAVSLDPWHLTEPLRVCPELPLDLMRAYSLHATCLLCDVVFLKHVPSTPPSPYTPPPPPRAPELALVGVQLYVQVPLSQGSPRP